MNCLCGIYLLIVCTFNVVSSEGVRQDARIFGGSNVDLNSTSKWPWLVAFVNRKNDKFFCAGTLIGRQYVLSAAHCFHPKHLEAKIESDSFYVLLGQLDLDRNGSEESTYAVKEIFVHPDWKTDETSYDADIAIVKLTKSVKFNENVTALPFRSDREFVRGGFVVGWGYAESSRLDTGRDHVAHARELPIRAVRNEDCFLEFPAIARISSRRTFCGGWPGFKANVCIGDSGGGFYILAKEGWLVQGIVSASYLVTGTKCNVEQYAVFTKVSSFSSWINMVMRQGDSESLSLNPISMDCRLERSNTVCRVQNFEIFGNAMEVVSSNSYTSTSPNVKVTDIIISNQNVFMIPLGLKRVFPNLVNLAVLRSDLKSVSRKGVAGLKLLALPSNQIVELPIDALWDCPELKTLDLNWNEIKNLDENLFIRSPNLMNFEANHNKIEHLHRDLFRDTQKLEVVSLVGNKLRFIDVDFFKIGSILKIDLLQNVCVNSTYDSFALKADQISKFKFHVEIATKCSRAGLCANSRSTQVIK